MWARPIAKSVIQEPKQQQHNRMMKTVWRTGFQHKNMRLNRFHGEKECKTFFLEAMSLEVQYDEGDNIREGNRPNE